MLSFESLKRDYITSVSDPYFSVKPRDHLRYISGATKYGCFFKLNPGGVEPLDYLYFSKADIYENSLRGAINALSNSKRAIHLLIDCFLEILGLKSIYRRNNFPAKLKIVEELDAFPTSLIQKLNQKRNIVEHYYEPIDVEEAVEFVEITELFVRLCYPFLKQMILGIHVGLKNDDKDYEWILDPKSSEILINICNNSKYLDTEIGPVFYNFSKDKSDNKLLDKIKINKKNITSWTTYLNTFIYGSKKLLLKEPFDSDSESIDRIIYVSSEHEYA